MKHGKGTIFFENGDTLKGNFENGDIVDGFMRY